MRKIHMKNKTYLLEVREDLWNLFIDTIPRRQTINQAFVKLIEKSVRIKNLKEEN